MITTRLAPAKINLMLHVVGRLPDGFHHLQSLIAFAGVGDQISVEKADNSSLTVEGPFGGYVPLGPDNSLVLAAQWFAKKYPHRGQVHIHLTKNLPISSGIGGGSSDAAATIAALLDCHEISLSFPEEDALILESGVLGADVPLCLAHQFGRGPLLWIDSSGRETMPIPIDKVLPGVLLLVNPGVSVSTPAIFKNIHPPYTPVQDFRAVLEKDFQGDLIAYLKSQKNDLMKPAIAQAPAIEKVMDTFQDVPGCLFAGMSGSGATCFGVFEDEVCAQAVLQKQDPQAWGVIGLII